MVQHDFYPSFSRCKAGFILIIVGSQKFSKLPNGNSRHWFFFLHNWQLYTSFWKMLHVNMLWNMPITLPFLKQVHFQHFSYFLWMVTHINLEEKTIYVTETSIKGWGLEVLMVCGSSSLSLSFLHFLFCFFFGNGRKAHTMILESFQPDPLVLTNPGHLKHTVTFS